MNTKNKENCNMKKYRMKGPDGHWWETMARSIEKARANFAYRLKRVGLFVNDAYAWAADTEEVTP
jgi:hypothetical protein